MKSLPLTRINLISSLTLLLALWLGSGWLAPAAYAGDDYFVGCGPAAQRLSQLKEGIEAANANTGLDTLILSPNCLYNFVAPLDLANESALPEITDDLLIRGQGATIQRDADTDRRFRLITIGSQAEVTIEDLALRHGLKPLDPGGGIYAGAGTSLTLKGVILQDNHSNRGGGVAALGPVTVIDSHFLDNRSSRKGGGLYGEAEVSVTGSRFENNSAGSGGGLYSIGTVTLTNTDVMSNTAVDGSGLYFDNTDGRMTGGRLAHNSSKGLESGSAHIISGTLTLTGTMIVSNTLGGGIKAEKADVIMTGGQVSGNQAAGLHIEGNLNLNGTTIMSNGSDGAFVTSNATIRDSAAISNTRDGMRIDGDVTVGNSRFIGNAAAGIDVDGNMTIRNSQFIGNQENGAKTLGEGVIENSHFADNHSSPNTGCGGAVIHKRAYISGSTFVRNSHNLLGGGLCVLSLQATSFVVNNLFIENEAVKGAAIYALLDPETFPINPGPGAITIMHNTIIHSASGSSAISTGVGRSLIYNNIIVGHNLSIQGYGGSLVEADHNLFFRTNFNYFGPIPGGPNDRTADPQFVDAAGDDFRLSEGSPAIDQGLDREVTIDLDGAPRPQGQGFDIGAYEFSAAPADPDPDPGSTPGGNFSIYLPVVLR